MNAFLFVYFADITRGCWADEWNVDNQPGTCQIEGDSKWCLCSAAVEGDGCNDERQNADVNSGLEPAGVQLNVLAGPDDKRPAGAPYYGPYGHGYGYGGYRGYGRIGRPYGYRGYGYGAKKSLYW